MLVAHHAFETRGMIVEARGAVSRGLSDEVCVVVVIDH